MEEIVLILDADDTLWESNVFYEEATDAFAERMAREGFDPQRAWETLAQIERKRVSIYGYTSQEFTRSLVLTYQHLCQEDGRILRPEVEAEVEAIGQRVVEYPIIHIPYHRSWPFEEVPVTDPEWVITRNRFADLLPIFPDSEEKP
ncbi:MAG: hypothetical protein ACUVXE_03685 [Anaerolineae bacterium]